MHCRSARPSPLAANLGRPAEGLQKMKLLIKIVAGAIAGAAILLLAVVLLWRRRRSHRQQQLVSPQSSEPAPIFKFDRHQFLNSNKPVSSARSSLRFHHLHQKLPVPQAPAAPAEPEPPFNWNKQRRLAVEAVENGWPCFAFSASSSESMENGWEAPEGSPEFMQTVRLNPGSKKTSGEVSAVRARLPLPGPAIGGGSFPQEAYFEITIIHLQAGAAVTVGLTCRGSQPLPAGTYKGSIGFHSDGSVYLDGTKLAYESEKTEWSGVNRVVGCGFEPGRKKVFFTVDGKFTQVIRCCSEEYGSPLFPVMAAGGGTDVVALVNLGQAPFRYAAANATRSANPCFLRQFSAGDGGGMPAGWTDSRELFYVHERRWSRKQSSGNGNDGDGVDESDLFEISLE